MQKKNLLVLGGLVLVLMLCACAAIAGFTFYKIGKQTTDLVPTVLSAATQSAVIATSTPASVDVPTEIPTPNESGSNSQSAPANGENTQAGTNVANQFLALLADQNYIEAVGLTNSQLRKDSQTAEKLRALVEDQGLKPDIWEWLTTQKSGSVIHMDGVVHFTDQRRGVVSLQIMDEDGDDHWSVSFLDLKTDGESIDPGPFSTWSKDREKEEVVFAKGAAGGFLRYWQEQNFDGTWLLTAQPMKASLDNDQQKLQDFLSGLKVQPEQWNWDETYRMIEQEGETHPVIEFQGKVNYKEGKSGPITIQLKWEDGYWSVLYIDIKAN